MKTSIKDLWRNRLVLLQWLKWQYLKKFFSLLLKKYLVEKYSSQELQVWHVSAYEAFLQKASQIVIRLFHEIQECSSYYSRIARDNSPPQNGIQTPSILITNCMLCYNWCPGGLPKFLFQNMGLHSLLGLIFFLVHCLDYNWQIL